MCLQGPELQVSYGTQQDRRCLIWSNNTHFQDHLAPAGAHPLACWSVMGLAVPLGRPRWDHNGCQPRVADLGDGIAASPEMARSCLITWYFLSFYLYWALLFVFIIYSIYSIYLSMSWRVLFYSPPKWISACVPQATCYSCSELNRSYKFCLYFIIYRLAYYLYHTLLMSLIHSICFSSLP